jgi:hypothetical protein
MLCARGSKRKRLVLRELPAVIDGLRAIGCIA